MLRSSPIDIEDALDQLKIRLSHPTMPTHRLVGILFFLIDHFARLPKAGFLEDVLELMAPVGKDVRLDGVRPEWLEAAWRVVHSYARRAGEPRAKAFSSRLLGWTVFQYDRMGSMDQALSLINEASPENRSDARPSASVIKEALVRKPALGPVMERAEEAHALDRASAGAASMFPVVPTLVHDVHRPGGYLRTFRCTLSPNKDVRDRVDVSFPYDGDVESLVHAPLKTARLLASGMDPRILRTTVSGTFSLDGADGVHAGPSGGLAMSLLLFCEIMRCAESRTNYHVADDCVLTGCVNDDGQVLPVDAGTFDAKVEATFFSGARMMVVPDGQARQARARVTSLNAVYPSRNLEIRGIRTVEDAFADRRIVQATTRNLATHLTERFLSRKWMVAAVLLGLFVGAPAGIWLDRQVDPIPASWTWDDTSFLVLNKDGDVLFRRALREGMTMADASRNGMHSAILVDITDDGIMDFVWAEKGNLTIGEPGSIKFWDSASNNVISWSIFDLELPYDGDISILHGRLIPAGMEIGDHDGDGTVEAYVSAVHEYYPSVIAKVNILSQEILEIYHHSGVITSMNAFDIDGDGRPELLVGGTNNAFDKAVFAVLDPQQIGGMAPSEGMYQPGDGPTNHEKVYLRMPITEVGNLHPTTFPIVSFIRSMSLDKMIAMGIHDSQMNVNGRQATVGTLYLNLDETFRPVAVGTTDGYDAIWKYATDQGLSPAPLDNAFKIGYMQGIERWTPDGWVPQPLSPRSKALNMTEP